jgi:RNA polymerase sigma factor (sigma-70 family)
MSSSALAAGLRHLRRKLALQQPSDDSDEKLLDAFTNRHDEAAFAALMQRHGPMVFHVCLRVLGHEQDAEDAFQATFLVLARHPAALRNKTSLASFLHGTAYRTAMKAKQAAARRRKHEDSRGSMSQHRSPTDPTDELSWREVRELLDEEIARLQETYQSVFILCYLENKTQAEAGLRLGLKERTVSNRLAAARKRLAQRLSRRGVELSAVLVVSTLVAQPASALPAGLMATTIQAAMATAAGKGLAGVVSASVVELIQGVSAAMVVSKSKMLTVVLLGVSLLASAGVGAYWGLTANAHMPLAQPAEPPAAKADDKPKQASPQGQVAKTVEIQGRVLRPDGKPKAAANLLLLDRKAHVKQLGTTAADGSFAVVFPKEAMSHWDYWLIAQADGFGMYFLGLNHLKLGKPVELRLVKDNVIRGRVINTEGKPVRGVRVTAEEIKIFANNSLDYFLTAWKNDKLDRGSVEHIHSGGGVLLAATTDSEGRFVFPGIGAERTVTLRFRGGGIADTSIRVVNRAGFDPQPYNQAFLDRINKASHGNWRWWMLSGPDVSVIAQSEKIIRGVVRDADTGEGRPAVVVRLIQDSDEFIEFPQEAKTDAQGRYEIHGIRKTKRYLLAVFNDETAGYVGSQVWADDTTGSQPITADIRVKKGVIITGKVIDGGTGKPIRGFAWPAVLAGNPFVKDYPPFRESIGLWSDMGSSDDGDDRGTFRVVTIPGPVVLMGGPHDNPSPKYKQPMPDPKYPQYFSVRDSRRPSEFSICVHPELGGANGGIPQGNFCKVLEIKPGVAVVEQDIVLERSRSKTASIQDAEGRPLAGAWAAGFAPESFHPARRIEEASCSVYGEVGEPKLLVFYHPDKKLAGTRRLKGDEKEPIEVKLGPAGSIKGQLLDADGKPLAQVAVDLRYRDPEGEEIQNIIQESKQIVTDANGAFAFDAVLPELKFDLSFRRGKRKSKREVKSVDPAYLVKPGECRDLGPIKLRLAPEKESE